MSRTQFRAAAIAAAVDVGWLVVFVVGGRSSHRESAAAAEALEVFAPFAIALVVAWCVARAWRTPSVPFPTGASVWLITAGLGLLLRWAVFGRSTAFGFVIIGTFFLMITLLGWRMVAEWWVERRQASGDKR